jgi:DUF1365 family protein
MTDKTPKPTAKRAAARKTTTRRRRRPTHHEISMRAYFIYLEQPASDELGNWLRAERELTPA